jgi:3-dehydroquinate synthetase
MIIHSHLKEYKVKFEKEFQFISDLAVLENTYYIIDSNVYDIYWTYFTVLPENRVMRIESVEENKTIETVLEICSAVTQFSAKRNSRIISIGGGITQDITGFACSILYRGIKWIFVPTTLLAACDSCIGGKTSLNYEHYKNLLGTFYPPDEIYICPKFFRTLSEKDFESGMGEVIKFNIMEGNNSIKYIEENISRMLVRDESVLTSCVEKSLNFKQRFIEEDEFDQGERIKLNFAHTFGHAIESITDYIIPHGTAVAIGMLMANYLSVKRGIMSEESMSRYKKLLLQVIHIDDSLRQIPIEKFLMAMKKDKKQTNEKLTVVLMGEESHELSIVHNVTEKEVEFAINSFIRSYYYHES